MSTFEEELTQEVVKELTLIKQHATPEQISRLDLDVLMPDSPENCIYGQMTGFCYGKEADKLIRKCVTIVTRSGDLIPDDAFELRKQENYFTALEMYIFHAEEFTLADIIKFLKGEIDTIDLPLYQLGPFDIDDED